MKKQFFNNQNLIVIVSLIMMCTLTSCIRKKRDKGKMVTRTLKVDDFHSMNISGNATVVYHVGPKTSVKVSGYEADVQDLKASVTDGCLSIDYGKGGGSSSVIVLFNNNSYYDVTIDVIAPHIDACKVTGNAYMEMASPIIEPRFELTLKGNSNCDFGPLKVDSAVVTLKGNSYATFKSVTAKHAAISLSGNSNVNVNLENAGDVDIKGKGNADVTLTGTLWGKVSTDISGNMQIDNQTIPVKQYKPHK